MAKHDYNLPSEWEEMSDEAKSRWYTQERCRRQAMRQDTPAGRALKRQMRLSNSTPNSGRITTKHRRPKTPRPPARKATPRRVAGVQLLFAAIGHRSRLHILDGQRSHRQLPTNDLSSCCQFIYRTKPADLFAYSCLYNRTGSHIESEL
jgi:hypothetical protein